MISACLPHAYAAEMPAQTSERTMTTPAVSDSPVVQDTWSLEFIRGLKNWTEVTENINSFEKISSPEDRYVMMFVDILRKPCVMPIYHNLWYVGWWIGCIRVSEIDYSSLLLKYEALAKCYKSSNDLHIHLEFVNIPGETFMQVNITSTNHVDVSKTPDKLGQEVNVAENTSYFMYPDNDGTELLGTLSDPEQAFTVLGVAYFTDETRTEIQEVVTEEDADIVLCSYRLLLLGDENGEVVGWVAPEYVSVIASSEI